MEPSVACNFKAIRLNNQAVRKMEAGDVEEAYGIIEEATRMVSDLASKNYEYAPTNATVLIRGESGVGKELVAAALTPDAVTLDEYVIPDRIALVVGQERHGVSPETIEACEAAVKIPMAPGVDSLNVAAASAVCLHALSHGERD